MSVRVYDELDQHIEGLNNRLEAALKTLREIHLKAREINHCLADETPAIDHAHGLANDIIVLTLRGNPNTPSVS